MSPQLSEKQQEVVDYSGKYLSVIAGAGSGKTRVLTARIKKLIPALKPGEKILAITFSNKASDELKERLVLTLGEKQVDEFTYIGTTHKFCLDLVVSKGHLIGLPQELHICESNSDRKQILKEAIGLNPQFTGDDSVTEPKVNELLEEISLIKRNLGNYADINDVLKTLIFKDYDDLLLQQGVIDFDDILRYAYQLLTGKMSIARIYRSIYKHICVDEAQDLNKAQYELIKALAGDTINITMVGDPNQAIYGFNGSSSDYFIKNFKADFGGQTIELLENYRSAKKIIDAANAIESSFEAKAVYPIEGELNIQPFDNEEEEAEYIYDEIQKLVSQGHEDVENHTISYEQCVVIARNRYVFQKLENVLKEHKIDYTLRASAKGAFSSESDLMRAFELGLRLIVNNKDRIHINEFSRLIGLDTECSDFESLRNATDISEYWQTLLKVLNKAWDCVPISENEIKFDNVINLICTFMTDNKNNIDEHDLFLIDADLKLWEQNWKTYIKRSSINERTLASFIRNISLGGTQTATDKGITLTTVHMSKGLEYDVVFVMGLNQGVFPDYRAVNMFLKKIDSRPLAEERHNMFVAVTRAKRLCYLTFPKTKDTLYGKKDQQKSQFLIDISNKIEELTNEEVVPKCTK